jgi:hypothetical protein
MWGITTHSSIQSRIGQHQDASHWLKPLFSLAQGLIPKQYEVEQILMPHNFLGLYKTGDENEDLLG